MADFRIVVREAFLVRAINGGISAYLRVIGLALNRLQTFVNVWFSKIKYDLAITPQVWSLERMLNDEFDPIARRIVIEEPETHRGWFFFRATDPQYKKFYFNGRAYFSADTRYSGNPGFTVVLPQSVNRSDRMEGLINKYKLISVKYTIINR